MKKIAGLVLGFVMVLSCGITGSATEFEKEDNRLISTENIEINGISTTVKTYDDQGFIVTTYEFTDEGLTETDMEGAIREIESEMASDAPMPLASGPTATASKKFNTSEHSPTDVSLTASQSGTFCKSIDNNYAYLWVVGGVSKAAYTSPDYTPSSIYITETFETTGLQVSVSWPPAVTSGSKIYERTLGPYNNVNFVTLNWPQISAASGFATAFSLSATTTVDANFENGSVVGHSASTSYKQNFQTGW